MTICQRRSVSYASVAAAAGVEAARIDPGPECTVIEFPDDTAPDIEDSRAHFETPPEALLTDSTGGTWRLEISPDGTPVAVRVTDPTPET